MADIHIHHSGKRR